MPLLSDLRERFAEARLRTDELFDLVRPDSLFDRPVPERYRLNFYIGHVDAFDWNMISSCDLGLKPFQADFDSLFAFGIDPDSTALPSDQPSDWPSLWHTLNYCRRVREKLDSVMDDIPEDIAETCIEHRLMHAETLCYLLHNLGSEKLLGEPPQALDAPLAEWGAVARQWIRIPAGEARLGRAKDSGFGWDNEFGEHTVTLPDFSVRQYKVTNGEYLAFVNEGGSQPHYWRRRGQDWMLRTLFGEIPLPLDWPVYVTHAQAIAFAEYTDAALPSEAQWDRSAYPAGDPSQRFPWGNAHAAQCANLDFRSWDPCSVTATPAGDSAFGVSQLLGNGWEWTCDELRPFPGFEEHCCYPGYSSNFFDDEHFVLKGGSQRTAMRLARRSFRNWFRQDYPYVYATFRLVHDE